MLLGLLGQAEQAAEGSKNYSKALQDNIQKFIQFTTNAHFSRQGVDDILKSLNLMPKQIKKAFAKPHLDVSGITSALASTTTAAAIAGAQAGDNYAASFRAALRIQSPSKVFMYYGRMLIEGLRNGWQAGSTKLLDAMTDPVQRALERFSSLIDKFIGKQRSALQTARQNLHSLMQSRHGDIQNLAGNISGSADLGGLFGTDVFGNPTVANVNTFLSGQAKSIENFAKDLKWGAKHGLSPQLLAEIAGLGAVQGDQVLQEFMSGAASIRAANRAEARIQRFSTATARTAEDAVYARREAAARKDVHENTVELKHLTRALERLERRTAREARTHITIDAKGVVSGADKQFLREIIRGIRELERTAGRKLL